MHATRLFGRRVASPGARPEPSSTRRGGLGIIRIAINRVKNEDHLPGRRFSRSVFRENGGVFPENAFHTPSLSCVMVFKFFHFRLPGRRWSRANRTALCVWPTVRCASPCLDWIENNLHGRRFYPPLLNDTVAVFLATVSSRCTFRLADHKLIGHPLGWRSRWQNVYPVDDSPFFTMLISEALLAVFVRLFRVLP